jgi:hypothetical protein
MAERSNAAVLKTVRRASVSGVRIPFSLLILNPYKKDSFGCPFYFLLPIATALQFIAPQVNLRSFNSFINPWLL